jgi:hypothetical protein
MVRLSGIKKRICAMNTFDGMVAKRFDFFKVLLFEHYKIDHETVKYIDVAAYAAARLWPV